MRPLSLGSDRKTISTRFGAVVVMLGLTVATTGLGTAWADTGSADTRDGSVTKSEPAARTDAAAEEKESPASPRSDRSSPDGARTANASTAENTRTARTPGASSATDPDVGSESADDVQDTSGQPAEASPDFESPEPERARGASTTPTKSTGSKKTAAAETGPSVTAIVGLSGVSASSSAGEPDDSFRLGDLPMVSTSSARTAVAPATATLAAPPDASPAAAVVETTTITPTPVSPVAEVAAVPARIVNAVLQLVGITTAAGTEPSPVSPEPLADLFFAVFRRLEEAIGLDKPVSQAVPPSLVYDGPLDTETPTVAQFLNAATAEYVLGGAPGGLTPFVVDGWQMTSIDVWTGHDATVWVTPQQQIIIAYSGTTGGTNLLFNPLITLGQILTDFEAGFTNRTPRAFTQSVEFAQQVQAEAAKQGYAPDDIFVTGHSLGAWQAQYVAQQLGLNGIGFEGPGLSTTVPGNGADSLFVNTATYGDVAAYLSSDLPGLYPFVPYPYVPAGGLHPHYGPIVLLGDPDAGTPMTNAAALWGKGVLASLIAAVDLLGNLLANHLPGVQAYNLGIVSDPGVVPWLGINRGPVHTGFGELTIPEFLLAASDAGILVAP